MAVQVLRARQRVAPAGRPGGIMADYKKLSELYAELDKLIYMKRNISEARENPQTKDHIFELDISPRINSRSIMGCKVKYRSELLHILDNEIKERQRDISQLSCEK